MSIFSGLFNQTTVMIVFFLLIIIHAFNYKKSHFSNPNEDCISGSEFNAAFDNRLKSIISNMVFAMGIYCILGGISLLIFGWSNYAHEISPDGRAANIFLLKTIFSGFPLFSIALGLFTVIKQKKP